MQIVQNDIESKMMQTVSTKYHGTCDQSHVASNSISLMSFATRAVMQRSQCNPVAAIWHATAYEGLMTLLLCDKPDDFVTGLMALGP